MRYQKEKADGIILWERPLLIPLGSYEMGSRASYETLGKRKKSKYDENAWWERDEVEIDGQWCGGGDKRLPSYGNTVSIDFPATAYGGGFLGLVNCLELVICRRWCVVEELEAEVSWFPFGL